MGKKFHILIIITVAVIWRVQGQTPADTIVSLPELEFSLDSLEPETPSSVPLGNEQLTAPRHYRQIIKPNAITRKGLFTVHKVDDDYYFEIPDSLLGRDLLVVSRIARGAAGVRPGTSGYAGDQIGTTVIRFEKGPSHNIFLRRISFADNISDSSNSMFNAVVRSNLQPLAASFDISAYNPTDDASVIEITDYLNGDNDILFFAPGTKQQMKIGSMLSNMCYIKDVQPFPLNIEIRTIKTYNQQTEGESSFTWELNTSILLLPRTPMRKRFADRRIGYFTERYTDYGSNPQGVEVVSYIKRWRLEPRPEDIEKYGRGELVEPSRPILFYIDPATPKKWVPYLIQGVEDWQMAFMQAGFKNAIIAKEAPPAEENPDWSLEDARHSVIVYKPSSLANATGPIITDPRSGEILESHINWYHNLMSLLHTWYMVQCGAVDPRARKMSFDDELMGSLIRSVACHEVGHALGLLHNFGASASTPVEILRNKEYVEKYGFCSSIMDYARFNYVAQPEDSISEKGLISRIGPYDVWAIQWGYRFFVDQSADEEKLKLNSWTSQKATDSRLWFGSEFAPDDPRAQTEDLGDNAMKAGTYGIKNLQRIVPQLTEWTKLEGSGYSGLSEIYTGVTAQYTNYLRHVTRYVGGVYETIKATEQSGPIYQAVPFKLQHEAMRFLDTQLFQTPVWLLDTAILSRIGVAPLQIIGRCQTEVLSTLLDPNTMNELVYAESMYGEEAYGLIPFFNDLENSIWSELDSFQPVDQYRRMLQRYYVERLIVVKNSPGLGYNDVIPMIISQLKALRSRIKLSLKKTKDMMTKNHLQYLYDVINAQLPADNKTR
ncbi:MAG TPA: zinc-dependent metalloprotease [Cyclobacteriaceae bacterium]|nr:zinc-dependent metalloprotease [Cyclobacteriaceae bacterium]